jgi:hypothetical protein
VLPQILEPVAGKAEDEQPWRSREGRGGDYDEDRCDIGLERDNDPASMGNREADERVLPEEERQRRPPHCSVVDDLHHRDRDGVGSESDPGRLAQRHAACDEWSQRQRVPEEEASMIPIEAALPQPSAVAMTRPKTSPIAQPVRRCQVAAKAARLSDRPRRERSVRGRGRSRPCVRS